MYAVGYWSYQSFKRWEDSTSRGRLEKAVLASMAAFYYVWSAEEGHSNRHEDERECVDGEDEAGEEERRIKRNVGCEGCPELDGWYSSA